MDASCRWQSPSGIVHAGSLLEMFTTCGVKIGKSSETAWRAVEYETELSCLNCKNVLMTDEEREQRRQFRRIYAAAENIDRLQARYDRLARIRARWIARYDAAADGSRDKQVAREQLDEIGRQVVSVEQELEVAIG